MASLGAPVQWRERKYERRNGDRMEESDMQASANTRNGSNLIYAHRILVQQLKVPVARYSSDDVLFSLLCSEVCNPVMQTYNLERTSLEDIVL